MRYGYDESGNLAATAADAPGPPQIVVQPRDQMAAPDATTAFSVVVADASMATFQWLHDGAALPGETGDSVRLAHVGATDEGQYSVVVTNGAGSVTSTPAELALDRDDDGLPDNWEVAHFGATTAQPGDDPDLDAVSNVDEYRDGTSPTSALDRRTRLIAYGDAGGTVEVTPMKLSYDPAETVTLEAIAYPPYAFGGWAQDLKGRDSPATLRMDINRTVRARFAVPATLASGCTAWWRAEPPAAGSAVADSLGIHDGGFFKGVAPSAPAYAVDGKVGHAFAFDASNHVQVPGTEPLRPAEMTAEAWVFPTTGAPNYQSAIALGASNNATGSWSIGLLNSTPQCTSTHLGSGEHSLTAPSAIPLSRWTHLAMTFDGTTTRLYVDGELVASQAGLGPLAYDAMPIPVTIGANWAAGAVAAQFIGRIDEVSLYSTALTAAEVAAIHAADVVGKLVI